MTYEEIVYKVQKQVIKSKPKADQHIAVQFNIVGEGEGAFYIEIDDGRISVQPYEYYDRDAVVYVDAETLFDVLEQKIAIADVTGSGKFVVQGNYDATMTLLESLIVKSKKKESKKHE